MSKHKLHKIIGEFLLKMKFDDKIKLILDPACGGNQNIPLFLLIINLIQQRYVM